MEKEEVCVTHPLDDILCACLSQSFLMVISRVRDPTASCNDHVEGLRRPMLL